MMNKNILSKRTFSLIDVDNLIYNINSIKKVCDNRKICLIVKDDFYGNGDISLCRFVCDECDYLAVSTIEEAIKLRKANIKTNITLLGLIVDDEIKNAIDYNIDQVVSYYEQAVKINDIAKKENKIANIQIAIDTGMGRIGFKPNQNSLDEIIKISKLGNIFIKGIFTHFSCCDVYDLNEKYKKLTDLQLERFNYVVSNLKDINIPYIHCCNSAGIIKKMFGCSNMVRPGSIIHGLFPNEAMTGMIDIKPILNIYSKICFIKEIDAGDTVSYGAHFVADKKTKVATISFGYGDGYPRILSNNQEVLINGKRSKILGNVTMDAIMCDVTNIDCNIGDRVTILGYEVDDNLNILYNGENISIEEFAKKASTSNLEVLVKFNLRSYKEYIKK